jgi:hypothetical protein
VRALLDDPAGLAAWEAEVRAEFRPVPWRATAQAVVDGVTVAKEAKAEDE